MITEETARIEIVDPRPGELVRAHDIAITRGNVTNVVNVSDAELDEIARLAAVRRGKRAVGDRELELSADGTKDFAVVADELMDAIDLASDQDQMTWLVSDGRRVAAIVPVDQAEHGQPEVLRSRALRKCAI